MYRETKAHTLKLLQTKKRSDGRGLTDYRDPITVTYDVSKTAEGSAKVQIGDTIVMAGVKMGIMTPYPDTPDKGSIMVNVELYPLSSPEFEPGPPGILAIELARVIDRGIREAKAVDLKELCIEKGEKVWSVGIDIVTINDAGNLFDACGLAALAALKNAHFPEYTKGALNYKVKTSSLPLAKEPVSVTVYKFGHDLVIDPDFDESHVYDARLTVASTADGLLSALQKGGDAPLTIEEVDKMVTIALEKAKFLRGKL